MSKIMIALRLARLKLPSNLRYLVGEAECLALNVGA